jgi:hypothetical protein
MCDVFMDALRREAIDRHVHNICLDRILNPNARVDPEAGCPINRVLPELVKLASDIRSDDMADYEEAIAKRICQQCGSQGATGRCPVRERADCCLYRYLPLSLDAIEGVQGRGPKVGEVEVLRCA